MHSQQALTRSPAPPSRAFEWFWPGEIPGKKNSKLRFQILVTTYDVVVSDVEELATVAWRVLAAPCRSLVSSSAIAPFPTSLSSSVIVLGGERLFRTAAERRLFRSECPGFVRLRLFVRLDEVSGICDEVVSASIGSSLLRFCGGAG